MMPFCDDTVYAKGQICTDVVDKNGRKLYIIDTGKE